MVTPSARPAGSCGHGHLVEFYETEAFLEATVADFLRDGLVAGGTAIVIATGAHREAFVARLLEREIDADAAQLASRLVLLDAQGTLDAVLDESGPDRARFRQTVTGVMDRMGAGLPLRLYGEMVALLWADGHVTSAIALEDLWNELAAERDFELLCAYPMSAFDDPADAGVFARVYGQHTDVIPSEGYSGLAQGDERQRRRVVAELQHEVRTLRRARGDDLAESARAHMYRALALEDPLTGLPNFRAFHDRVERASESREQMTLLLVDVDQLKEINEQQGHAAGDAVLIEVGRSIVDELLPGDVAARVGGDEFGVLLSPRSGPDAAAIAELIRAGVQQRCSADNATVSIGGTGCDIDRSGATLSADRALYESKLHGRNRVTFSASVGRPSAQ